MMELLQKSPIALDIQVTSASLGYCAVGDHDPRVEHAAQASGLSLPPRSALCFDEVDSIVNTDLVLVMDRFDFSEVGLGMTCRLHELCLSCHTLRNSVEFSQALC